MKAIVITTCVFLLNVNVIAQNIKKNTFQTPDVASLAAEVQTPVSLSSGSMSVEIPLYTLTEGDIEVPVSLGYDATGVRVGSHPGWTGQNWTLKAGGMITRVIKGVPDEARVDAAYIYTWTNPAYTGSFVYPPGYMHNYSQLSSSSWNSTSFITSKASLANPIELEPDEFIFNFCGQTGTFYWNSSSSDWKVVGKEGYIIESFRANNLPLYDPEPIWYQQGGTTYINDAAYTYCNSYEDEYYNMGQARYYGFKITDPRGFVYYFGQFENATTLDPLTYNFDGVEITSSFFEQVYDETYSTWYLMKIVSPRNRQVTFTYENGYPVATFNTSYTATDTRVTDQASFWNLWSPGYLATYQEDFHMDGSLIRPQYLKSIEGDNVKIELSSSVANARDYDYTLVQTYLNYIADTRTVPTSCRLTGTGFGPWPPYR